jgi:UDP-N-acetylmuramoyl-tripeptide--D-alanyl-D-alanine ligase
MRSWSPSRLARAAGAKLVGGGARSAGPGPLRASIDSREVLRGDLFVGLAGEKVDGGAHAPEALANGAWGVLVKGEHVQGALAGKAGVVLEHADPLQGLQALARAWRAELAASGARVVAVTGSTGKTSTKDILTALLGSHHRVAASPQNLNTEIGLPLALLAAGPDRELIVLEMAMRGSGQIAELARIASPDVGVIVNVGPVHLELLGSLEAIARAKAELIAELPAQGALVLPAAEPLLAPYLREDLRTITFGPGGDVQLAGSLRGQDGRLEVAITIASGASQTRATGAGAAAGNAPGHGGERLITLRPSFSQAHNLLNLLAAVAAADALGVVVEGELDVTFSALRGERIELDRGVVVINDCYNANPMSVRAAIDDLAETAAARRVAVLGDMLELGPRSAQLHREIGEHARRGGVDLLVTVGPQAAQTAAGFGGEAHALDDAQQAAELLPALLADGDTVLVKGSRAIGLERVAHGLAQAGDRRGQRALSGATLRGGR